MPELQPFMEREENNVADCLPKGKGRSREVTWSIYTLVCVETNLPFYVGATRDTKKRLAQHMMAAKHGWPTPVCRKIRNLWQQRLSFQMVVMSSGLSEGGASAGERSLIAAYGLDQLCNVNSGPSNRNRYVGVPEKEARKAELAVKKAEKDRLEREAFSRRFPKPEKDYESNEDYEQNRLFRARNGHS